MPLDWLNTPLDADIGELIARKKRARAIEALRQQLQGRLAPPVPVRLQLADLLMQAGRTEEAVPVLLGLADEFASDGFVAKAVAILKRVDKAQPGRADVAERLEKLVQQQKKAIEVPARPRPALPELGMEEFSDEPAVVEAEAAEAAPEPVEAAAEPVEEEPEAADTATQPIEAPPEPIEVAPEPSVEAAPEPVEEEPEVVEVAPETLEASPEPVVEASPELLEEAAPEPLAPPPTEEPTLEVVEVAAEPEVVESAPGAEVPPPAEAEATLAGDAGGGTGPGVGRRIRRALWRFLASLPGAEEAGQGAAPSAPLGPPSDTAPDGAPPPAPPPVTEPGPADAPQAEPSAAGTAEPAPVEIGSEAPAPAPAFTDASPAAPALDPAQAASPAPEGEEAMTEEVFRDQLLDIVEDVLHRPPGPEEGRELDRERVLDLARRLVATRLFQDLSEEELLAIVRGLRLRRFEAGDIVVTEGEPGQGLFTLTTGRVKVFVRNPDGRNFEVAALEEGDFFGEISSLSGRPRTATVVAAERSELLELDRPTLDAIARTHARVRDVLEASYIERASSAAVAAVRAVPLPDAGTRRKAEEVLEAHFGESRWDPRMRLRLADVLLKAGKDDEAVAILVGLADELARAGFADKAVAILKKIEQVQRRNVEVVNLAPLLRGGGEEAVPAAPPGRRPEGAPPRDPGTRRAPAATDDRLHGWLLDLVRDTVAGGGTGTAAPAQRAVPRAYGPGLLANPLFEDFSEEELLAFIQGLKLLAFEPGDVIVTEGEPGQSVFILTTGRVKVFVRGPGHHDVPLGALGEGSFFGEISTLSGRPRSATITAAAACEILELDRPGLDAVCRTHPRVRTVLEAFSEARAADPEAARARGGRLLGG